MGDPSGAASGPPASTPYFQVISIPKLANHRCSPPMWVDHLSPATLLSPVSPTSCVCLSVWGCVCLDTHLRPPEPTETTERLFRKHTHTPQSRLSFLFTLWHFGTRQRGFQTEDVHPPRMATGTLGLFATTTTVELSLQSSFQLCPFRTQPSPPSGTSEKHAPPDGPGPPATNFARALTPRASERPGVPGLSRTLHWA